MPDLPQDQQPEDDRSAEEKDPDDRLVAPHPNHGVPEADGKHGQGENNGWNEERRAMDRHESVLSSGCPLRGAPERFQGYLFRPHRRTKSHCPQVYPRRSEYAWGEVPLPLPPDPGRNSCPQPKQSGGADPPHAFAMGTISNSCFWSATDQKHRI